MNKTDIEKNYPKSYSLLKSWVASTTQNLMGKDQNAKAVQEVMKMFPMEAIIMSMLSVNQRQIFDYLDNHNVFILINKVYKGEWSYSIGDNLEGERYGEFLTRKECEEEAIKQGFSILEKILE